MVLAKSASNVVLPLFDYYLCVKCTIRVCVVFRSLDLIIPLALLSCTSLRPSSSPSFVFEISRQCASDKINCSIVALHILVRPHQHA